MFLHPSPISNPTAATSSFEVAVSPSPRLVNQSPVCSAADSLAQRRDHGVGRRHTRHSSSLHHYVFAPISNPVEDLFWVTPPPRPRSSRPPICSAQSHGLRSARRGAPARSAAASSRCPEEVCFFAALDMEVGDLSEWARVDDVHGLDVVEVTIGALPLLGGARPSYHPFSRSRSRSCSRSRSRRAIKRRPL